MHNILKSIVSSTVAACVGLGSYMVQEKDVQARNQPAFLGAARHGADAGCFYEAAGGPVQKFCTGKREWVLPLVTDKSSLHKIWVTARGANEGAHNVSCRAYGASQAGALSIGSAASTVFNNGATESLEVNVFVPNWGAAWVTCMMEPGTRLFSTNYAG